MPSWSAPPLSVLKRLDPTHCLRRRIWFFSRFSFSTLSLLGCFVYLGVRRAGIALAHYESVWNRIRDYFYSGVDRQTEPYSSLNIRASGHTMLRRRWTGMQALSEAVVMLLCLLVIILQTILALRLFWVSATWWERMIGVAILVVTFATALLIAGTGSSFRRGPNN